MGLGQRGGMRAGHGCLTSWLGVLRYALISRAIIIFFADNPALLSESMCTQYKFETNS